MDLGEFEKHLYRLMDGFFPDAKIQNLNRRLNMISLRMQIGERLFIDVYYNTDSDRLDFTTIKDEQRIFGYDNAGGWHYHPLGDPDHHEPCPQPTLEEILERTAQVISQVSPQEERDSGNP